VSLEKSKSLRWWIIEDALRDRKGHWVEYLQTFQRGLAAEGDQVRFFASKECAPELVDAFAADAVLPKSIWARMSDGAPKWRRLLRIPSHGLATYRAVSKLLAECQPSHAPCSTLHADRALPDLIFVPTVLVHHLVGWIPLIKGKLRKLPCRVILFFPNAPVVLGQDGGPLLAPDPTAKLFRCCIRALAGEVASGKVVLGAETHPMVRALTEVTGVPFTYLPHPVEIPPEMPLRPPNQAGRVAAMQPILFGSYGPARHEKGSDVLQAAIRLVLEADPEICAVFALQWLGDFHDERGHRVTLDPWIKNHPKVRVIDRYFREGEYLEQVGRTGVIILPYRDTYRLRVSRVVIEAMVLGKPVIVTAGTTLHDQAIRHGVAESCENACATSLAQAIRTMLLQFEPAAHEALAREATARSEFSVRSFREKLAA